MLGSSCALLMWCALVTVVAAAYAGARTTIGDAYRVALRRWFPQLLVSLAFLVLGLFARSRSSSLYVVVCRCDRRWARCT